MHSAFCEFLYKNADILIETEGQVALLPMQNKQAQPRMCIKPLIL